MKLRESSSSEIPGDIFERHVRPAETRKHEGAGSGKIDDKPDALADRTGREAVGIGVGSLTANWVWR